MTAAQTTRTLEPPPARWWHPEDDKIVCDLCPRYCKIAPGKRGFCYVRANDDGKMVLTTYGRSSGFCIDPIEKKPLNHFIPGTPVLSFGTAGCNLGCKFCQNWDISKSREMDTVCNEGTPEAIVEACKQANCRSIAFTYNDPVIFAEYAIDIARLCRAEGIKTVAVTAGYITEQARDEFYEFIDAANVDLKAFTELFYKYVTLSHLQPVLDTLKWLKHSTDVWFEITNLIIPTENDSSGEIDDMCKWIVDELGDDVPIHFTAFHPDFKMLDKPATPHETLIRARQQALDLGIKYAYTGNVDDKLRQSTYCHNCGKMLIGRDWYELSEYNLTGNRCQFCDTVIPGVFEQTKGDWGRRRVPIRIHDKEHYVNITVEAPKRRSSKTVKRIEAQKALADGKIKQGESITQRKARELAQKDRPIAHHGNAKGAPVDTDRVVSQTATATSTATAPRVELTGDEQRAIVAYTRALCEAAVQDKQPAAILPPRIADAPTFGLFVSLRRPTMLRGCRGQWGAGSTPNDMSNAQAGSALAPMLAAVAPETALRDTRFPAVTPAELPYLNVEVSLMFEPVWIDAAGPAIADHIAVGTHGLVIHHPRGRGLLLPHVATENGWNTTTFLDRVCVKANLPPDTWRRDSNAKLMSFRANLLHDAAPQLQFDARVLEQSDFESLLDAINAWVHGAEPGGDGHERFNETFTHELGLYLQTQSGVGATAISPNMCLWELARVAARSLRTTLDSQGKPVEPIARLTVLWEPVPVAVEDYPARCDVLAGRAAFARVGDNWTLIVPRRNDRREKFSEALRVMKVAPQQLGKLDAQLIAFSSVAYEPHQAGAAASQKPKVPHQAKSAKGHPMSNAATSSDVRPPARANQFYPGNPNEMVRAIDQHLATAGKVTVRPYRAVMLPHAGWIFCGDTLAKTIARVTVPDLAIIIGPKHTSYGPPLSIAPHRSWQIPGATVPVAHDWARRLAELAPQFELEPDAHGMEHGSEVIVPFLYRINRNVTVLPIVIGGVNYNVADELATAIATLGNEIKQRDTTAPLLVISSDMNHFANEQENRRRDMLAVNAMLTGDPQKLYGTCINNDISMCGMVPAVTVMRALQAATPELQLEHIDYTNSAAVSGDTSRVVGYAGVVIE